MSKAILTHTDLDGISCYIVLKYFNFEFDGVFFYDYSDLEEDEKLEAVLKHDQIWVTDLALPPNWYKEISKKKTYWIHDHHEATAEYQDDKYVIYDPTMSGTKNIFEAVRSIRYSVVVEEFVDLVDTYDMWKKDSPLWVKAQDLHRLLYRTILWQMTGYDKFKRFISEQLAKLRKLNSFAFTRHEKILIEAARAKAANDYQEALLTLQIGRQDRERRRYGIFKASANVSYICGRILEKYPELDYIICINTYRGENNKISVRTKREDLDLNDLYGVEGHKAAAGGQFDPVFLERFYHGLYRSLDGQEAFLSTYAKER